jgi:diadenosine tetraphosphate (Ap4A) HIT family hydrolase
MSKADCVFCKIARGEAEASVVYEDGASIAFLDTHPIAEGHTLVAPKQHYVDVFDIEPHALEKLILSTKTVAQKIRDLLHADGVNMLHASGEAAEQTVFHFHIHVIPRKEGDKVDFNDWWATKIIPVKRPHLNKLAAKLRATASL